VTPAGIVRPFVALAALAVRVPAWLLAPAGSERARRLERSGLAALTRYLGIETVIAGEPVRGGTLFVSNHISWADIPVYGGVLGADFVAKAEVAGWPLLGRMARRMAPIFVARERRGTSGAQAEAIRARLREGRDVLLFAEGTTSDGEAVLPFRSTLFAAADAAQHVQPVALLWLAADGSALTPERLREVAWVGDDSLLQGVFSLAQRRTRALLKVLPQLDPAIFADRKALALAAREAIVTAYAAALNRSR